MIPIIRSRVNFVIIIFAMILNITLCLDLKMQFKIEKTVLFSFEAVHEYLINFLSVNKLRRVC